MIALSLALVFGAMRRNRPQARGVTPPVMQSGAKGSSRIAQSGATGALSAALSTTTGASTAAAAGTTSDALPVPVRIDRSPDARVLATWLALVITVALLNVIGFVLAFGLLTLWIVAVLYQQSWRRSLSIAVSMALAFEVVFVLALGVELPRGPLGF
ncbi:MAG: tripartite tricarboxylate transporter TctB family protein [Proteobacteria bacterium]|nr:tripartite tricarboxylate transporter TctB family protein [Burkholderiales bacterium]